MPTANGTKSKVRRIGKGKRTTEGFNNEQLAQLAILMVMCVQQRVGLYMGPLTTTGSIKFRFYDGDTPSEIYISALDNVWDEVQCVSQEVFDADALAGALASMASWRVEKASDAPLARK